MNSRKAAAPGTSSVPFAQEHARSLHRAPSVLLTQLSILALVGVLAVLLGACASTPATGPAAAGAPTGPDRSDPYRALAEDLAVAAGRRVDLHAMRVLIDGVHARGALAPGRLVGSGGALSGDLVGAELRHELEFALAERLHVVGATLGERPAPASQEAFVRMARESGATHAFVAEYARRDGELILSARLVDVESMVVVAIARGAVDEDSLSDPARRRLKTHPLGARELPPRKQLVEADVAGTPEAQPLEEPRVAASAPIEPIEPQGAIDDFAEEDSSEPSRPGPFELWQRARRR